MDSKTRFEEIIRITRNDKQAAGLIAEVAGYASAYVTAVVTMEATLMAKRAMVSATDLKDLSERLDRKRTLAHNTLIDSIRICNRYLFKKYGKDIPVGGIYSGDPFDIGEPVRRVSIGNWAGEMSNAFFTSRRL